MEAGWHYSYLSKKMAEGTNVTRWIDASEIAKAADELRQMKHEPTKVHEWIENNLDKDLLKKMNQAIRAKRKRYFDSEHEHKKKKSIDIEFQVWKKLSEFSVTNGCTLSEAIEYLITNCE
ncbi:Ter macrodomain-binding protein MatP [Photobacterium leiognathi]|nr:Ter macrodomain-binding protein MatP [Photobacterium leiognathi]